MGGAFSRSKVSVYVEVVVRDKKGRIKYVVTPFGTYKLEPDKD